MAPQDIKLTYFPLPGKAEVARILLNYAGVEFKDDRIDQAAWAELKPKSPFGQLPILEVNGKTLAQSGAIFRYTANLAGLYPSDPWAAAKVEEVSGLLDDVQGALAPANAIQDPVAKAEARKKIAESTLRDRLNQVVALLASNPSNSGYFVGDSLTLADILVFHGLSWLTSGFIDGIPSDLIDHFPKLREFHTRIASLPAIAKQYANAEGLRLSYKPKA